MPKLTDRTLLVGTIVAMAILTSLPLIVGYASQGKDHVFVPRIAASESDSGAYYSNIEQVRQGRILLSNQFTSEAQQPTLFHPLWIMLGWLAWLFHISTPAIFQLARLAGLAVFIVVLDRLIRAIPHLIKYRWLTLWLVLTSSGLGWIIPYDVAQKLVDKTPLDFWVSEANTFLTLSHSILFIGSQLMIGFILWQLWKTTAGTHNRWWRWTGPTLLAIGFIHPYDLILLLLLGLAWSGWTIFSLGWPLKRIGEHLRDWGIAWLWVVPIPIYYLLFVLRQPAMYGWLKQNYDVMGPIGATIMGFGLLLPMALIAAWQLRHQRWAQFLSVWAIVSLAASYAPGVSIQRRLLNGIHIPLALLAAACLIFWLQQRIIQRMAMVVALAMVVILFWTNLENTSGAIMKMTTFNRPEPNIMITTGQFRAMTWIRDHSTFDQVTWSDYWNGNTLAGLMARTVALGHGNQTVQVYQRLHDWAMFTASSTTSNERLDMMHRFHVTWLLWYPAHDGQDGYNPRVDPIWHLVEDAGDTQVYQLQANLAERN